MERLRVRLVSCTCWALILACLVGSCAAGLGASLPDISSRDTVTVSLGSADKTGEETRDVRAVFGGFEVETTEPDRALPLLSVIDSDVCTIEKRTSMTTEEFEIEYDEKRPVVLVNMIDNSQFREMTTKERLLQDYGASVIILSSANTFSYEKRKMSLSAYIEEMMQPQRLDLAGNETWYHFGNNDHEAWKPLFNHYNRPPPFTTTTLRPSSLSFGLGGHGSGVPLHVHGAVYSEVLHGRKRWFLYPPEDKPEFDPNETTLQWLHFRYPTLQNSSRPIECTIGANEILYLPSFWWHSTLNVGENVVFVSTFV